MPRRPVVSRSIAARSSRRRGPKTRIRSGTGVPTSAPRPRPVGPSRGAEKRWEPRGCANACGVACPRPRSSCRRRTPQRRSGRAALPRSGRRRARRRPSTASSSPSIGVTGIQPTFCIVCTVCPTSTTSTQVISRPVAISIFLCGSFRSSAITRKNTADHGGEAEQHALEHGPRARLQRQRLQEEHRLEALAVDAREAERDEPDRLRGGERRGRPRRGSSSSPVQVLQVLLPVDPVVEPVEDQQQHADRDERDDRLELLAPARPASRAPSARPPR